MVKAELVMLSPHRSASTRFHQRSNPRAAGSGVSQALLKLLVFEPHVTRAHLPVEELLAGVRNAGGKQIDWAAVLSLCHRTARYAPRTV